jgi:hypothetical protein
MKIGLVFSSLSSELVLATKPIDEESMTMQGPDQTVGVICTEIMNDIALEDWDHVWRSICRLV